MSQENERPGAWVRTDLSPRTGRASQRRGWDERLLVLFPAVYPLVGRVWTRLSQRSRLRRAMLARGVPRTCAALNRRDFAAFLLGFHPSIEFRGTKELLGPDQAEVAIGHEGVLHFLEAWFEAIEDLRYDPAEVLDFGNKFLVTVNLSGHGSASGAAVSQELFVLSYVRRGWVVKQENFLERSQALEAAGLSE
jgi:ketosteroid isomerase-like protein